MDQIIYWLDNSNLFAPLGAAWPYAIITAIVAVAVLAGIVNVARRYGNPHNARLTEHRVIARRGNRHRVRRPAL